ncbi:MAG: arylsulfotransferase family protein [Albidovulum sp.]
MSARTISFLAAIILAAILAFLGGMWTTYKTWWPWEKLTEVREAWRSFRATGYFLPDDTFARRKPEVPDERHTVHDATAVAPGYWAINRYDPPTRGYVFELLDETGAVVLTFPIDYSRIRPGGKASEFAHIATVLPDGSVLVVWDDAPGMARLDACGDPVWARTDRLYHHSIERGVEGYWTWATDHWYGAEDQDMIRFDPMTGEILESINIIDDVIEKSMENRLKLTIPDGYRYKRDSHAGEKKDIFHPNDLEELMPEMAAAFPGFEAGDLLVSLRNIHALAVIGRRTGEVRWVAYGPWRDQHDPDFQPDGTISVFSNNTDRFASQIISIDPQTGVSRDLFAGAGLHFDSFIMGKHEHLPNGNWMITPTIQGRVMEVTPEGRIVREYNNILNAEYNALTLYAEHLEPGYLAEVPKCAK